jgi:hypothetical protein
MGHAEPFPYQDGYRPAKDVVNTLGGSPANEALSAPIARSGAAVFTPACALQKRKWSHGQLLQRTAAQKTIRAADQG